MITFFQCKDIEEGWFSWLSAQGEREMAEWERQEDIDHEEELAIECVENDETDEWPAYADAPLIIEDPEIFDDVLTYDGPIEVAELDEDE